MCGVKNGRFDSGHHSKVGYGIVFKDYCSRPEFFSYLCSMRKITLITLLLAAMTACTQRYVSYTDVAQVNGVGLFYAAEGHGKPVILLHGNGGSHNDMETTQRGLAQAGYMVYALDSRGQGANSPLDEYHYKDMATDVYEFIKAKGLDKPAVFGFSDGGIIALQTEVMYPGTFGAIATGGANIFVEDALIPSFAESFLAEPSSNPLSRMMQVEPTMTPQDMQTIRVPALIMAGEHDLILEDHTRLIASSIPGAELRIIPGEDHGSYICNTPKLTRLLLDFFERTGY